MTAHRTPTERSFGLSIGAVCLGAAAWSWWRGRFSIALALTVVGALLVGGGLLAPSVLRVPNQMWWRFAQALGWINTRIILTLFFFLVLTPVGVFMRLCGRNPLTRRAQAGTNWSAYVTRRHDPRHYDHLF